MAAVVSSNGIRLYQSFLILGSRAPGGNPAVGCFGDQVYVNAATGNLVLQQRDEFLSALGPDVSLITVSACSTVTPGASARTSAWFSAAHPTCVFPRSSTQL
jgi:hypothetical protein